MPFDPLKFTGSNNGASVAASNTATVSQSIKIGDLVIVVFGEQTALTATTCTDNLGNVYQALNAGVDAGTSTVRAYWTIVATAGTLTGVSVVATASGDDFAMAVACFQGPFTGAPDANPANASDIASPFAGPATGTLTQKDELIISYFGTSGNATWSATAPLLKAIQASSSTNITVGIGYQLVNSTSTVTPGWTGTNPTDDSFGTATFTLNTAATSFQKVEWMGDVPAFFAQREFPLSLRGWVSDPQAPFPPFPNPIRQRDWPVPLARDFNIGLRTWAQSTTARMPVAIYMPGRVFEWGMFADPRQSRTWADFNQDLRQAPPVIPFAQDDWPVPVAPAYSISLRTFIAINPPLLATSPPPPILMPPLIVEWGVSDRTTFEPARIQYNAPLLTAAPIQPPFNQDDWPVPSAQRQPDRTYQRSFPPTLVGQDKFPIRQQNWLVPIAPDYSVSLRSFLARASLPLITAPVQSPFSQDDWPLPIAAIQPIRTWAQSPTIATPIVAPTFMPGRVFEWGMWQSVPFTQADLPQNIALQPAAVVAVEYIFRAPSYTPQWAGPRFETWTTAVNLALRAGPPPPKPFTQTDWPITPAPRQPDRTYQRSFPPELIGQDRLPFRQQSWPLTPATEFVNALRSIGFRSPALDVIAPRPFRQTDWPLTPWQARAADLRTYINKTPINLIGKDRLPIRQQDWPLPTAPRPAADLRTYIAQSPIRLIGKDRLPFRQNDWPVPRAHLEFHTLRSITQGRVIYGGEVAPIPPEPPLPPPEVIHSVRAHADAYYGVFYADEIKGRADFSRAKGSNDEEAAN